MAGVTGKSGRRAGIPNKITTDLRAMVLAALDAKGGQAYLEQQAQENPTSFLTLVGKCMPQAHTVSGDPANPLVTEVRVTLIRP